MCDYVGLKNDVNRKMEGNITCKCLRIRFGGDFRSKNFCGIQIMKKGKTKRKGKKKLQQKLTKMAKRRLGCNWQLG